MKALVEPANSNTTSGIECWNLGEQKSFLDPKQFDGQVLYCKHTYNSREIVKPSRSIIGPWAGGCAILWVVRAVHLENARLYSIILTIILFRLHKLRAGFLDIKPPETPSYATNGMTTCITLGRQFLHRNSSLPTADKVNFAENPGCTTHGRMFEY